MSNPITLSKINEVFFRLDLEPSQAMELKEHLSFYAANYKYHPQFKAGFWNGKIYFFNSRERLLPIGLMPQFVDFCEKFRYPFIFDFDRTIEFGSDITDEQLNKIIDYIFPTELNIYPRFYQQEAILKALKNKRGVLQLATGAGKSVIIYTLIRTLIAKGEKVILVVPTVSLVEQMFSDFKQYGWDKAGDYCNLMYSGQRMDDTKQVLITTWQSVYTKGPAFFNKFTGLIIDEVHTAKGVSIQEICKNCSNASYRIGLTGTVPKEDADRMTIFGYLGPILYKLGAKELMDQGVLSAIEIRNLIAKYPEDMKKAREDYQRELKDINNYEPRTPIVLKHIFKNSNEGDNHLILVQRIEHLKAVRDYLVDHHQNYEVYTIFGDTDPAERERIRKLVDSKDNVILVCTYATMSTGVNIKKLHNIIFFASYKSEIKVIQSIGRGLRTHESKNKMVLWDVIDDLRYTDGKRVIKNYSYNHWEKFRLSYYEEQGFQYSNETINI